MSGWIKLHRKLTEWEWYNDVNTSRVFIHLLLSANHKDAKWRGIDIKRGQKLTSLSKLSSETSLSVRNIRTSLSHLKSTNEVTSHSNAQHTVFTVVNYDNYQSADKEIDSIQTNDRHPSGKRSTTNKNDNKEKNDNKDTDAINRFDEFWDLYDKKTTRAKCEPKFKKLSESDVDKIFESLPSYIASTPDKKYRKDPQTWLNGKCWNDEVFSGDNLIDYNLVINAFNDAMRKHKEVPVTIDTTASRIRMIDSLVQSRGMTIEGFEKYFNYVSKSDRLQYFLNGLKIPARGIDHFIKDDVFMNIKESKGLNK